jgi:hypothetical protein
MNDFLRQIEAYSNERLDKFLPVTQQNSQQTLQEFADMVRLADELQKSLEQELKRGHKLDTEQKISLY